MLPYSVDKNLNFLQSTNQSNVIELQLTDHIKLDKWVSKNIIASNPLLYQSQDNNYKLISRNFFIELMNKFWSETIFLSIANQVSDTYIDRLKSDGLSLATQDNKSFLYNFSKALINGRIQVIPNLLKDEHKQDYTTVKYIWKKGFNFSWPEKNSYILSFFKNKSLINSQTSMLSRYLSINKFPMFTIVNNLNQIVLSESSNEILISKSILERLYNLYSHYFLDDKDNRIKYQSLFFVNPYDAHEYKEYIDYKYDVFNLNSNLKVFTTRLDIYYYLMKMKMKNINFRVIPDLKEVGEFVSSYQYYKNIKLDNDQYCMKNTFQGQPIYFIESMVAKNKQNGKIELIKYRYLNHNNLSNSKYTAVFMNYKTALLAWKKFRQQMFMYDLPVKPNLTVYNLESFIKKYDNNAKLNSENMLFVPSIESYFYLKNTISSNESNNLINQFINRYSYLQIFAKRIIWSLTSRQPTIL